MIDFTAVKNLASKFTVTGAQKAHIDRLVFELGVLEKHVGALEQKLVEKDVTISELQEKVRDMAATITDLEAKLNDRERVNSGLDEEEAKILKFFFDAQEASCDDAARFADVSIPVATHHVGTFLQRGFLRQSKASMGRGYPAKFRITHEGSSHIMKNG